jgi:hypothetical protein
MRTDRSQWVGAFLFAFCFVIIVGYCIRDTVNDSVVVPLTMTPLPLPAVTPSETPTVVTLTPLPTLGMTVGVIVTDTPEADPTPRRMRGRG